MKAEVEVKNSLGLIRTKLEAMDEADHDALITAIDTAKSLCERHGWSELHRAIEAEQYNWQTHWKPIELVYLFAEPTEVAKLEEHWRS